MSDNLLESRFDPRCTPRLNVALLLPFFITLLSLLGCSTIKSSDDGKNSTTVIPSTPLLSVELGMHSASVGHLAVDEARGLLLSVSDDKTVRLWRLEDGEPAGTIRVPSAPGHVGKLYSVASSPDGELIAVGGRTHPYGAGQQIYIFQAETGALLHRIEGLPNATAELRFTRDGQALIAGLAGIELNFEMRVYHSRDFAEIARDATYEGPMEGIDIADDGRIVTTSGDGLIRMYDNKFKQTLAIEGANDNRLGDIAFSPDGGEIAIAYLDRPLIQILSSGDLSHRANVEITNDVGDDLSALAWSEDGQQLCAAGRFSNNDGQYPLRCWAEKGRGSHRDIEFGARDTVREVIDLPGGGFAAASNRPLVAVLDADGSKLWVRTAELPDFRDQRGDLGLRASASADVIEFGYEQWGKKRARLSFRDNRLEELVAPDSTLFPAVQVDPKISVTDWLNSEQPKFNGRPITLEPNEVTRSLAFKPSGDGFALGSNWHVWMFDGDGKPLWRASTPGIVWSLLISKDNKTVVAGLGDGTIRLYDAADGKEKLAFFAHPDGQRWVAWLPEGFFTASENGTELIGYHLNRGPDQLPDFVRFQQLIKEYYRPDLPYARMSGNEALIRSALTSSSKVDQLLTSIRPPRVELLGSSVVRTQDADFTHRFRLLDQGAGIGDVTYRINGVAISPYQERGSSTHRRGLGRRADLDPLDHDNVLEQQMLLGQGRNVIDVEVQSSSEQVASRSVRQTVYLEAPTPKKANLYGLAIGINDYRDQELELKYAAADALAVKEALETNEGGLYREVSIELLRNRQASRRSIWEKFEELSSIVRPEDVFVLYMSGHGFTLNGRYYFVTQDAVGSEPDELKFSSLAEEDLANMLASIGARQSLIILDTCHAGSFAVKEISNPLKDISDFAATDRLHRVAGRAVLAASTDQDVALEGYKGHGLYTYLLLQGLQGQADRQNGDGNGFVNALELGAYLVSAVPKLSEEIFRKRQVPSIRLSGQDFFNVSEVES